MTVRNMPFLCASRLHHGHGHRRACHGHAGNVPRSSRLFGTGFAQFLNIPELRAIFFLLALWAALSWPKKRAHTAGKFRPAG